MLQCAVDGMLPCSGHHCGFGTGQLMSRSIVPFKTGAVQKSRCKGHRTRCEAHQDAESLHPSRRDIFQSGLAASLLPILLGVQPAEVQALGFTKELKKRKASIDEYSTTSDGLRFLDLTPGSGGEVAPGMKVTVHFDCIYKGIDVVSSRQARLLGGNRTISEPFEFTAGSPVTGAAVKKISDSANGLFSGSGGPKPPPALSTAVLGMRSGGKRSIIVPPEVGYGDRGLQEIPPNGTFELRVEVLSIA